MWRFLLSLISAARLPRSEPSDVRSAQGKRIWLIGPMPPPLNGQSNYNQTIARFFADHASLVVLPTGSTGGEKIMAGMFLPLIILLMVRSTDRVYTSPPGQTGIWLFMATIAALRLRRLDHFVHHHSFRPINLAPMRSARILTRLGSGYQRHVFLSENMRQRYADVYLSEEQRTRSFVLPNAFFFSTKTPDAMPLRSGPVTIGHLSVITREKGIGYLMEVISRLADDGLTFKFLLAGPIKDPELKAEVDAFCLKHAQVVKYLGPVFDQKKEAFYRKSDIFVLPSRLIDEADPLVILEAFGHGSDVVASSTGCIPERVLSPDRLMLFDLEEDVALLKREIEKLEQNRESLAAQCIAHGEEMHIAACVYARIFFAAFDITLSGPQAASLHNLSR